EIRVPARGLLVDRQLAAVEGGEVLAGGLRGARRPRPDAERGGELGRRRVGVVHRVSVQEEEEALAGGEAAEELGAAAEGALDVAVGAVLAVGPRLEAAREAVAAGHVAPLAVPGRAVAGGAEELGQSGDPGRQDARRRIDVVLPRLEAGEHR